MFLKTTKYDIIEKICRLNELYLCGDVSAILSYLRDITNSYKKEGYHSFVIDKFDGYYWLLGSRD